MPSQEKQFLYLFPTIVYLSIIPDYKQLNAEFLSSIKKMQAENLSIGLWQSGDELHTRAEFQTLCKYVTEGCLEYIELLNWRVANCSITAMWANVLRAGASHKPHIHSNNLLSGVYYVQASGDDASHELYFSDPRLQAHIIEPDVTRRTEKNAGQISFSAEEGRLYLFPSWLSHFVGSNMNSSERISVSFNITATGALGSHENLTYALW